MIYSVIATCIITTSLIYILLKQKNQHVIIKRDFLLYGIAEYERIAYANDIYDAIYHIMLADYTDFMIDNKEINRVYLQINNEIVGCITNIERYNKNKRESLN